MFYSGFNTCPSRGLKANTLRTALSQNGEYIFIRARGQRSNLNSSEFKGCNSNVRGRVHLQAARRLFKVSSEIVEAQSSLLRIQKQILRPLHPHLEPRLTATLVPKSGERMKFLERLLEPFTAAIIAVFSILTNCFFKPRHGAFVITGMRVFLHSLIFFYLSINFLHERCRRICRLTFVSWIVWVYSFREGCKILRLRQFQFHKITVVNQPTNRRTLSYINRYRNILTETLFQSSNENSSVQRRVYNRRKTIYKI